MTELTSWSTRAVVKKQLANAPAEPLAVPKSTSTPTIPTKKAAVKKKKTLPGLVVKKRPAAELASDEKEAKKGKTAS